MQRRKLRSSDSAGAKIQLARLIRKAETEPTGQRYTGEVSFIYTEGLSYRRSATNLPCKNTIKPREAMMKIPRKRDILLSTTSGAAETSDCEDLLEREDEEGWRKSGDVSEAVDLDGAADMAAAQPGQMECVQTGTKTK